MANLVVHAATPAIAKDLTARLTRASGCDVTIAQGSGWMPNDADTRLLLCRDHLADRRVNAIKAAIRRLDQGRVVVVDKNEENWDRVVRELLHVEEEKVPTPVATPVAPRRGLLPNGRLPVLVVQSYATSLWANSMQPKLVKRGFEIVEVVPLDAVHDRDEWPEHGQAAVLVMYSPMPSGVKLPPKRDDMPVLFLPHKGAAWDLSVLAERGLLPSPVEEVTEMPAAHDKTPAQEEPGDQVDANTIVLRPPHYEPDWITALREEAETLRAERTRLTEEKNSIELDLLLAQEDVTASNARIDALTRELEAKEGELASLAETNATLEAQWLSAREELEGEHVVVLTPGVSVGGTWPALVANLRQQVLNQGAEVLALRDRAERAEKAVLSVPPPTPSSTLARLNGEIARLERDLARAVEAQKAEQAEHKKTLASRDAIRLELGSAQEGLEQSRALLHERLDEVARSQQRIKGLQTMLEQCRRELAKEGEAAKEAQAKEAEKLREQILAREAAERELSLALHDLKAAREALKAERTARAEAPAPAGLPAETKASVEGVFALYTSDLLTAPAALELLRKALRP